MLRWKVARGEGEASRGVGVVVRGFKELFAATDSSEGKNRREQRMVVFVSCPDGGLGADFLAIYGTSTRWSQSWGWRRRLPQIPKLVLTVCSAVALPR